MHKYSFICALVAVLIFGAAQERKGQPGQTDAQSKQQNANTQSVSTPVNNSSPQIDNATNTASSGEHNEGNPKDNKSEAEQLRQNQVIADATYWMAVFAGINLLIAIIYAIFAGLTLRAIQEQSGHAGKQVEKMQGQPTVMEEAFKNSYINDRAYVGVHQIKVTKFEGDKVTVTIWFRNGGRTPAWDYQAGARLAIASEPRPFAWSAIPTGDESGFMPSEQIRPVEFKSEDAFTSEHLEAVKNGSRFLFIDGEVHYSTIGRKRQVLCFGVTSDGRGIDERYQYEREDETPNTQT